MLVSTCHPDTGMGTPHLGLEGFAEFFSRWLRDAGRGVWNVACSVLGGTLCRGRRSDDERSELYVR